LVEESAEEMELRDAIQKIAVEMPAYGHRRITAELRRADWVVNRKRVLRIMREDNLLCLSLNLPLSEGRLRIDAHLNYDHVRQIFQGRL
jgi:hypothetical protein